MHEQGTLNPHSSQATLFPFLEKHHDLAACHSRRAEEESAAPLEMIFITLEIPQQPGQPEKVPDHVTVFERACGRSRELRTH